MKNVDQLASLLTTFSSMAVSIGTIIALLATIFKPVRKFIVFIFDKLWDRKDKIDELMKKMGEVENTLSQKVDDVKTELTQKIQDVSNRNDEDERDRIRWEVLDFARSCRNGKKHSQDEYRHIIELNTKYHKLLARNNAENGVFDVEYEFIKNHYAECLEKNDFLNFKEMTVNDME